MPDGGGITVKRAHEIAVQTAENLVTSLHVQPEFAGVLRELTQVAVLRAFLCTCHQGRVTALIRELEPAATHFEDITCPLHSIGHGVLSLPEADTRPDPGN